MKEVKSPSASSGIATGIMPPTISSEQVDCCDCLHNTVRGAIGDKHRKGIIGMISLYLLVVLNVQREQLPMARIRCLTRKQDRTCHEASLTETCPPSFHKSQSEANAESACTTTSAPSSLSTTGQAPAPTSNPPATSTVAVRGTAPVKLNAPMLCKVPPRATAEGADHSMSPEAELTSVAPWRIPTSPSSPDT